jgi:hypothetical protein
MRSAASSCLVHNRVFPKGNSASIQEQGNMLFACCRKIHVEQNLQTVGKDVSRSSDKILNREKFVTQFIIQGASL